MLAKQNKKNPEITGKISSFLFIEKVVSEKVSELARVLPQPKDCIRSMIETCKKIHAV